MMSIDEENEKIVAQQVLGDLKSKKYLLSFVKAAKLLTEERDSQGPFQVTTSLLQRKLKLRYSAAANIYDSFIYLGFAQVEHTQTLPCVRTMFVATKEQFEQFQAKYMQEEFK